MSERDVPRQRAGAPGNDHPPHARLERIWERAYGARTQQELISLYADWAESYDADHETIGFFGHETAGRMLARYTSFPDLINVLDAGAGTGAAGQVLVKLGYENITAIDLSVEMLERAAEKEIYRDLFQADLGKPLDQLPTSHFDACILVGVFSYGQAPAHALDEILRVVKPGGVVVFTMRTDFHRDDAMGVRSKMDALAKSGAWRLLEATKPQQYLPLKEPDAMFRVWCYRVLPGKTPAPPGSFASAVRKAFGSESHVKRLDHCYIWNSLASRLYDLYTECPGYYLTRCEEEILRNNASAIAGSEPLIVELGCGSARKIRHLLEAAIADRNGGPPTYVPIDLSAGALAATRRDVAEMFDDEVPVEPLRGHFNKVLPGFRADEPKALFFFGSSIGNIESIEETIRFLSTIRSILQPGERIVFGADLHKSEEIFRKAYEAGPANRSFFLNMVRRINEELGGNFELDAFRQFSPYEEEASYEGIRNRCVNLRLVTEIPQEVYLSKLDLEVHLDAGDAVQVGTSRKYTEEDIAKLAEKSGLRLARQWFDEKRWFSVNELVREDVVN